MTALTQAQTDYLKQQVNNAGGTRYSFVTAVATNNDQSLGVVVVWTNNGELRAVTVSAGANHIWLQDLAQFANVVDSAVKQLSGRLFDQK
jgi:hypothetical protein